METDPRAMLPSRPTPPFPEAPPKALPPIPSLPRVLTVPPIARRMEAEYLRRLFVSIGLSILINLLLLAVVSSAGLSQLLRLSERPKPKGTPEAPKLVLVPKPSPPLLPEPDFLKLKTFLETDPSQAAREKPKNAEFYSEHNTVATQVTPSAVKPGDVPKADGSNVKSLATENVRPGPGNPPSPPPAPSSPPVPPTPKTPPTDSAPSAATPSPPASSAPQPPLPPPAKESDLALLRREPPPKPPAPKAETPPAPPKPHEAHPAPAHSASAPVAPSQPSTDREVLALKSKLDGGVGRTGRALAFNSEESPFASYDKKVIAKIGVNWNYLLESRFYGETVGQVVVAFKLLVDGRVSELRVTHNTANAILANYCVQAIEKSAPFVAFPESLRAMVGDSRDATITFNY